MASGAVRNHDPEIMVKAFNIVGLGEDDVKAKFPAMYNAFCYGAPPHAGIAPGVDRMVMLIAVVDDETHVMEERAGAELYSEIFYRNHNSGLQYACTALSYWGADGRQAVAVCLYIRFNYSSRSGHDAQTRRRDLC